MSTRIIQQADGDWRLEVVFEGKAPGGYPACNICGGPATCIGAYEGNEAAPACSTCCGHGNEDGWCLPLNEARVE